MLADKQELAAIAGVTILESDDPLTIHLFYNPNAVREAKTKTDTDRLSAFHFRISIPPKYPFHPPLFKWLSRPPGHSCSAVTPFLGPNGDVSNSALSQWTPASSLSNVLISLFPSAMLAAQCCSVTSHIWLMGVRCFLVASSLSFPDGQSSWPKGSPQPHDVCALSWRFVVTCSSLHQRHITASFCSEAGHCMHCHSD